MKPAEKTVTLTDGNGLSFVVDPSGARGWRLRYYRPDGRRNMISLGSYPQVTLAQARLKVHETKLMLADGIDPAEKRKADKLEGPSQDKSFQAIAREWHDNKQSQWKPGSSRSRVTWGILERHVLPSMGSRQISEISPMEWLHLLKKLEAQGIHEQKRRVRSICRDVYKLAIVTGRATTNPLADLDVALKKHKSENMPHVPIEELPALMRDIHAYTGHMVVRRCLQLLFLTMLRPGELRLTTWSELDLERGILDIPADRMKMGRRHQVPLPQQAVSMLLELQKLNGNREHVFVVQPRTGNPLTDATLSKALRIMGYADRQVPHGVRHLCATELREQGYPRAWVEAQLSHKVPGTEGVYTHAVYMRDGQRPEMMQSWADHLESISGQAFRA